jgi:hypothetical protein
MKLPPELASRPLEVNTRQAEQASNPWQYDGVLMEAASRRGNMASYCEDVLANEPEAPSRFVTLRAAYVTYAKQSGLRYFKLVGELYTVLVTLRRQRLDIARDWLQTHGHRAKNSAPVVLEPHTPAWFEALSQWDPMRLSMDLA